MPAGKKRPNRNVGSSWTIDEARSRLQDLLRASIEEGPQEIRADGRVFIVTASNPGERPSGREILRKGGPLEDDDSID